jgi:2-C-methyl-D-erythritol 4-phosphate cytidylyltransferase
MGRGRNKVLLDLAGEPIIVHTIRHLSRARWINQFVVVVRDEDRQEFARVLAPLGFGDRVRFANGGAERSDSVGNGIAAATSDARWILVHDAARPFVGAATLAALRAAALTHGAAIPALPLTDTVKRVAAGAIVVTLDRTELAGAQTPQIFAAPTLRAAREACEPGFKPTDDAALFEHQQRAVAVIPGDPLNVKLTTPDDLALAPARLTLFREREGRGSP